MYMHAQAPMYVLSHSDTLTHKDIHSHAEAVGSRICICKSTHVLYTHPQGYALTRRGSWLTHLHLQTHAHVLYTHPHPHSIPMHTFTPTITHTHTHTNTRSYVVAVYVRVVDDMTMRLANDKMGEMGMCRAQSTGPNADGRCVDACE